MRKIFLSLKATLLSGKIIEIDDSERTPCEIYSRVMGYYRPITTDAFKTSEWNPGKVAEFKERKYFKSGSATDPIERTEDILLQKTSTILM